MPSFTSAKHIEIKESWRKPQSHLPSGTSQCADHLKRRDKGRVTSQGLHCKPRLPRVVRSKSSLSGMSLNLYWPFCRLLLGLYSALLLGLIIESVACRYEFHIATGWIPVPQPVYIPEKGKGRTTLFLESWLFPREQDPDSGCWVPTNIAPQG